MFGCRPRIPIDLLFLTRRQREIRGVDRYVMTLYEHLKSAIAKAKTMADKEAARFKRIYDKRAGAIALHPGDKVLIPLDTFTGTSRKLKN